MCERSLSTICLHATWAQLVHLLCLRQLALITIQIAEVVDRVESRGVVGPECFLLARQYFRKHDSPKTELFLQAQELCNSLCFVKAIIIHLLYNTIKLCVYESDCMRYQ